ncbi:hypothetical protein, partial [uncultured Ruegeria sp.]|uniref:hypothetical protein n=1 Tax=uncultured Ruegeria sp. TaxID=259304 RepID=UPI002626F3AA
MTAQICEKSPDQTFIGGVSIARAASRERRSPDIQFRQVKGEGADKPAFRCGYSNGGFMRLRTESNYQ